jgi:hypothetical protein
MVGVEGNDDVARTLVDPSVAVPRAAVVGGGLQALRSRRIVVIHKVLFM